MRWKYRSGSGFSDSSPRVQQTSGFRSARKALAFKLTGCTKGVAVFERPEDARFQKITYERSGDAGLKIRLEGKGKEKPMLMDFELKKSAI